MVLLRVMGLFGWIDHPVLLFWTEYLSSPTWEAITGRPAYIASWAAMQKPSN